MLPCVLVPFIYYLIIKILILLLGVFIFLTGCGADVKYYETIIDDDYDLIASHVLEPICSLKTDYLKHRNPRLHTDEVLLALTISALNNPTAQKAKEQLSRLQGAEAHFTVIISDEDEQLLRRLGINVSCQPQYEKKKLYHK